MSVSLAQWSWIYFITFDAYAVPLWYPGSTAADGHNHLLLWLQVSSHGRCQRPEQHTSYAVVHSQINPLVVTLHSELGDPTLSVHVPWPYISADSMKVGQRNGIASASERCLLWRQPHLPTLERSALQRSAHRLQIRRMRLAEPVKPACTARAQPVASTPTSSRRTGTELAPPFRVVITGGTKGETSPLLNSSE